MFKEAEKTPDSERGESKSKKKAEQAAFKKKRKRNPYDDRGTMETRAAAGLKRAFPEKC